jgi:4-diphosphocytidyl-2-C-methyl-D-erythritol kinase
VKAPAYAKVNLTLEVLGRRDDGYHALRSVVQPISLADELELTEADGISCDSGYEDDLCVKAARTLARVSGVTRGVRISVKKRIPVGGGLGGGSADAAAVLVALDEMWKLGKSRRELAEIGAAVGSDVPALVLGDTVLMEGRGEKVSQLAGDVAFPRLFMVLANPGVFCSTAGVFSACTPRLHGDGSILYNMTNALRSGDWRKVADATMNDLEVPASALHPEISAVLGALKAAGARGVSMSGSGSTVFGFVPDEARGREIAALMNAEGYWAESVHTIVR